MAVHLDEYRRVVNGFTSHGIDQLLAGEHFMKGDTAAAEGGIAAGCRFFGGYPITPASEIAERMAERLPVVGGEYIQMEDELASIAAVIGASNAGAKSMTATSGPGVSVMKRHNRQLCFPRRGNGSGT